MSSYSEKAKEWSADFARRWRDYPEPARPTKSELAFYSSIISKSKSRRVLILGSTIEFRVLCKKLKCNAVCVDYSRKNFEILATQSKLTFNDKFVECNWLELPFSNEFDFVLGDWVFNMLNKKDYRRFFKNVSRSMKKGGVAFLAGGVYKNVRESEVSKEIEGFYRLRKKGWLYSYLMVPIFPFLSKNGIVKLDDMRKYLYALEPKGMVSKRDADYLKSFGEGMSYLRLSIPAERELKKSFEPFFTKYKVFYGKEEYCAGLPVFVLMK